MPKNKRQWTAVLLGSGVYALFAAFGIQMQRFGESRFPAVLFLALGLFLPAVPLLSLLLARSARHAQAARPITEPFCTRRAFFLLAVCYAPMFLLAYPGCFAYDVPFQLRQIFTGAYSTHHPLIHTLLMGACVALGRALGHINAGAALYTALQTLLLAFCFAQTGAAIARQCGARAAGRSIVFFALYPLHMFMAVSATKDTLFGGFFALTLALGLEALGQQPFDRKCCAALVLAAALAMMLRNNARYAMAVWLVPVLLLCRKRGAKAAACMVLALVLGSGTNALLARMTHAQPGDKAEMLSWPIQQLARARNLDADRLSDAEKAAIDALMPNDAWQLYDPTISDPVKFAFDTARFESDRARYIGIYLSVGAKCPQTYLDAVLMLTNPFFCPYAEYGVSGYYLQLGVSDLYYDDWCDFERITAAFPRALAALNWRFGAKGAMQIPVIGWAFNMGLIVWVMGYFVLREWYLGRWTRFAAGLLPVLLWGTFLLGPVMAGRYIYPFVCMLPVLAAQPHFTSQSD